MSDQIDSVTGLPVISNNPQGLNSVFQNTINYVLAYEKQPMLRLQQERDALDKRKTAYAEIGSRLTSLQSVVRSLYSTSGYSTLATNRAASVVPLTSGTTIATVTSGSGAVVGSYDLSVTSLAAAERHVSNTQASASEALGYSGAIWLGGTGTAAASISSDPSSVLSSVSTGEVASGTAELGYGDYTVETKTEGGSLYFRLKNVDGEVVQIKDSTGTLTTEWISFTVSSQHDTGRGLVLHLSGNTGSNATVSYTAKGVSVTVNTTDSLINIASNINAALQPEGREITATVVGTQLVLTAAKTGTNHKMILNTTYSENLAGLSFADSGEGTQAASNAAFTVSGISFTTQSNTGLTNVISGATINLAADAAGKQATIQITNDTTTASSQLESFVTAFNRVIDYINEQTALTQDVVTQTYTRAALANETVFSELRSTLFEKVLSQYENSGSFTMLNEIGITIGDDLKISISDSSKLASALENNYEDVTQLLDEAMSSIDETLSNYTGSSGYLDSVSDVLDEQYINLSNDIQNMQLHLIERKSQLEEQYAKIQADLLALQYAYNTWRGIYGNTMSFLG